MALSSPALTLAVPALFGNVKPVLNAIKRLGPTDFSADAPEFAVKPGATVKVPVASITAAAEYNESTNNYGTGGATDWASLTAKHYLKGFDVSGTNIDQGVDQQKIEQIFALRAGSGIAYAIQSATAAALDSCTASTGVTLPAKAALSDYLKLNGAKDWFDGLLTVLALNGSEYANLKSLLAEAGIVGDDRQVAGVLGFKDVLLVPGMAARACVVPEGSLGFLGRVPALVADYAEDGVETDPDTGLSVGIVVNADRDHNRRIVNADIWFGVYAISSPATAVSAGVIKVGTAS